MEACFSLPDTSHSAYPKGFSSTYEIIFIVQLSEVVISNPLHYSTRVLFHLVKSL
jgi:hypothetical protein